mgnify:CR=1 FL=1
MNHRSPIVQARVLDGKVRLGVVIPPVSDRLSCTLRKYTLHHEDLRDLVHLDSLSPSAAALLSAAMMTRTGIVVSGIPAAGKTTLVNALIRAVPPAHRVLGCEETRELSAPIMHGEYYQTRTSVSDATGDSDIALRDLVRICLGMRPDLLVVGEVRGEEAFELTRAGNAGCGRRPGHMPTKLCKQPDGGLLDKLVFGVGVGHFCVRNLAAHSGLEPEPPPSSEHGELCHAQMEGGALPIMLVSHKVLRQSILRPLHPSHIRCGGIRQSSSAFAPVWS